MHTVRSRFQKTFFTFFGVGIFVILVASFAGIFGAHTVLAQTAAPSVAAAQNLASVGTAGGLGTASLGTIIARIIQIFFGLLGLIALVITLYGGFKWMLAKGDAKQVDEAKDILKNGVIGLVIIFSAFSISNFLVSKLFGISSGIGFGGSNNTGNNANTYLGLFDGASGIGQVVAWHDPIRDAVEVSRNTVIQVKFKFPIDPASLINVNASSAVKKDGIIQSGPLKTGSVYIYVTKDGRTKALTDTDVWVTEVQDGTDTMYVFDPIPYLGSASENTPYTVEITNAVNKLKPQNVSAFSGFAGQGYKWNFTVGTKLDLTPPRVISVVPKPSSTAQPRNITLQVTFSEPINLASAVGVYDPKNKQSFDNITARDSGDAIIPGAWRPGDGFSVVEFTTLQECATNACGQKIFCLPANDPKIELRALSGNLITDANGVIENAQIDVTKGYVGVTDASNNALDGGGENGIAPWSTTTNKTPKGTPADDYFMHFGTSGVIKVSAPQVLTVEPVFYASSSSAPGVTPTSKVSATFDSLMRVTSFDGVDFRAKNPKAQAGFWKTLSTVDVIINSTSTPVTKMSIDHVPLAKDSPYAPIIPSTVLDNFQNCFLPASGAGCKANANNGTYSCCNGVESTDACTSLQQYGKAAL